MIEKNSVDAVVRILLFTIFADKVLRDEEFAEARKQLVRLEIFAEGSFAAYAANLEALIEPHAVAVRKLLGGAAADEAVNEALAAIDDPLLIPMVLSAMRRVSLSDKELHHEENSLIDRAAEAWGIMVPLSKE